MSGDNWMHPAQVNEFRNKQYARLYKTTYEPINITKDEEMTYFNNEKKSEHRLQYDLYFSFTQPGPLFDGRKSKENRQFLPDIHEHIFQQERRKAVPAIESLQYGRRKQYDRPEVEFNRIDQIQSFYRRNGALPVIERPVSYGMHAVPALD